MTKWIDAAVVWIALVGLLAILLANPHPMLRDHLCGWSICFRSDNAKFWNTLGYDVGMGVLLSAVFYWLLVKLPELRKRRRLRKHLQMSYLWFRREITTQLMFAANENHSIAYDDVLTYSPMAEFRQFFKTASQRVEGNRWHDVGNGMTDSIRKDLFVALTLLRDDVSYVLNVSDVNDDNSFMLLHGLQCSVSHVLLDPAEGDQDKNLLSLLWQLMAGWDWLDGYPKDPKHDRVQHLINSI